MTMKEKRLRRLQVLHNQVSRLDRRLITLHRQSDQLDALAASLLCRCPGLGRRRSADLGCTALGGHKHHLTAPLHFDCWLAQAGGKQHQQTQPAARSQANAGGAPELWIGSRIPPEQFVDIDPDHPFAYDLDLVGERSLSRLLDVSITQEGRPSPA